MNKKSYHNSGSMQKFIACLLALLIFTPSIAIFTLNNAKFPSFSTKTVKQEMHAVKTTAKPVAAGYFMLGALRSVIKAANTPAEFFVELSDIMSKAMNNVFTSYDANGFAGDGSFEPAVLNGDIYEISNAGQLYWFAEQVNNGNNEINGKLMSDITVNTNVLNSNKELNSGTFRAWTPIGYYSGFSVVFLGDFDGNGKTIRGLYCKTENSHASFIGAVNYHFIKDLTILDSYFEGTQYVSGICGYAKNVMISGCRFSGRIKSTTQNGGGMCSYLDVSTMINCESDAKITAGDFSAGIAGYCRSSDTNSNIVNCIFTGSISGTQYLGGICGRSIGMGTTNVINCANKGTVSGTNYVGGVVGYFQESNAVRCSNTGSISGSKDVGGLFGYGLASDIQSCYNAGTVTGSSEVGGIVGSKAIGTTKLCHNYGSSSGSALAYHDQEGISDSYYLAGSGGTNYGTSKTAEEFAGGINSSVRTLLNNAGGTFCAGTNYPTLDHTYVNCVCTKCSMGHTNHTYYGKTGFCDECGYEHTGHAYEEVENVGEVCTVCGHVKQEGESSSEASSEESSSETSSEESSSEASSGESSSETSSGESSSETSSEESSSEASSGESSSEASSGESSSEASSGESSSETSSGESSSETSSGESSSEASSSSEVSSESSSAVSSESSSEISSEVCSEVSSESSSDVSSEASSDTGKPDPATATDPISSEPEDDETPEMLNGDGQKWKKGSNLTLKFRSSADFADFLNVKIDGILISSANYIAEEGSTIITLKPAYLEKLDAGEHTITISSKTGDATAKFTVVGADADGKTKTTGDDSSHFPWLILMALSLAVIAKMLYWFKLQNYSKLDASPIDFD